MAAPLGGVPADPVKLDQAVITLRWYSLVDATDQVLGVHRLVQAVVRHRLGADGERVWAASAARLVNTFYPQGADDVRTWAAGELLLAHALVAAGHAERLKVEPKPAGWLLNRVGLYLLGRTRFAEARAAVERALTIIEAVYGPDHPTVAIRNNNVIVNSRAPVVAEPLSRAAACRRRPGPARSATAPAQPWPVGPPGPIQHVQAPLTLVEGQPLRRVGIQLRDSLSTAPGVEASPST